MYTWRGFASRYVALRSLDGQRVHNLWLYLQHLRHPSNALTMERTSAKEYVENLIREETLAAH